MTVYHKFYTLDEVNTVVETLCETIKKQNFISLAGFNKICGDDPFVEDEDIGWTKDEFDPYVTTSSDPISFREIYILHVSIPTTSVGQKGESKTDSLSEERKTDLFETPDREPKTEKESK